MSAKPGMFVELLDFSVPVVVGNEFDLATLVFFLAFGGGDNGEEFPVGVVDGIFKFTLKAVATRVGVSGFDKVVDQSKKEGAVARAHEGLGGFWKCFVLMIGKTAVLIAFLAFAGAEREMTFFGDLLESFGHDRVIVLLQVITIWRSGKNGTGADGLLRACRFLR